MRSYCSMVVRCLLLTAAATVLIRAQPAASQPAPPSEPIEARTADARETPRGTLLGFLNACRRADYRRAASFLNLRKGQRRAETPEVLASELKEILDGRLQKDANTVSNVREGDLTDGLDRHLELIGSIRYGEREVDFLLERVSLPEIGQIWLVSAETVGLIPLVHADLRSSPIEKYAPEWMLRRGILDTALWQWLALLLLILVSLAAGDLLARAVVGAFKPIVRHTRSMFDDHLIDVMRRPLQLMIALAACRVGIVWIAPSYVLRTSLGRLLTAVIHLALAWIFIRLVNVMSTKLLAAMSGPQKASTASIMPLLRRTLDALAIIIAVLATLSSWGFNLTAVLAGLGVGGVAVALAAQKTIENLFGGVAITTDKPIMVGDFCRYGDKVGTVEDIGLRSTRIRSLDRTVVTVPNADFSMLQIENFGRRDKMSFRPILQLRRDTAPAQLRSVLGRLRKLLTDDRQIERSPRVRLLAIGPQSLDVEIFSYVLTEDYDEFLLKQEELLLQILAIIAEEGTALAIPMQLNLLSRDSTEHHQLAAAAQVNAPASASAGPSI